MVSGAVKERVGGNVLLLQVLKLVMSLTFLGWLMMWGMMPTDLWRQQWRVQLREKTNSTWFGKHGSNALVYCLPMMLISVLACVYQHLKEKHPFPSERKRMRFLDVDGWLSRPLVCKGPLGVMSSMELTVSMTFLGLLVWCFSTYVRLGFPKITEKVAHKDDMLLWEEKVGKASDWMASVGVVCLAFLFLPVCRGSVLLKLAGLAFEESIRYHMWMGHTAMTIFTLHGASYIILWTTTNKPFKVLEWAQDGVAYLAGVLALCFGLLMWVTTLPRLRAKLFELFFYTHQMYVLFIVFFVFHVGPGVLYMFLPALYLFVVDRVVRFLQSRRSVRLVSARILPCMAVELTFSKRRGLRYGPMSTVFINVPSISTLQWHPFTVTSCSELQSESLSVVVKCVGTWTQSLYGALSAKNAPLIGRFEAALEGPYEPPPIDFLKYQTLVMICGGNGITPFVSVIHHLLSQKATPTNLLLVSVFKHSQDLAMLDLLVPPPSISPPDIPPLQLQIEAFVTQEQGPAAPSPMQTIWFEPHDTDTAISWQLGPNHWLCLGALISSSFLLFMALVGVVNHFHIHPQEIRSKYTYPMWLKGLFVLVFMFTSIIFVSVTVSLLNKKKEAMDEDQQVQHVELQPPTASPSGWPWPAYDFERGIQSFNQRQSLIKNVRAHYGRRPNFHDILANCDGPSVGVLVCGPNAMRTDVARVCSGARARTWHYHSINFTW